MSGGKDKEHSMSATMGVGTTGALRALPAVLESSPVFGKSNMNGLRQM